MTVLSAQSIRERCQGPNPLISPFGIYDGVQYPPGPGMGGLPDG
jgi:hypothetical protein